MGKGPILSGPVLRIVVASATAATLLLLRFKVMGSTLPVFTSFDNPASYEAAPAKQVRGVIVLNVQCFSDIIINCTCCDPSDIPQHDVFRHLHTDFG